MYLPTLPWRYPRIFQLGGISEAARTALRDVAWRAGR